MAALHPIVFARARHTYDSYLDYYRLVVAAGYSTCFIDEIDLTQPMTYVTTPWNGETPVAVHEARARGNVGKVVWHLLERDPIDAGNLGAYNADLDLFDEIWVSDRSYANLHPKLRHVVLGGHPLFGDLSNGKQYDVCALAYLWGRRKEVTDKLVRCGVSVAPDAYGEYDQNRFVATSRLMLNMHQYDTAQIIAPIRFAVAASYNLPLVTESVRDPYPLVEGQDFLQASIADLPALVDRVLGSRDLQQQLALGLRSRLVLEHRFDVGVNAAVDLLWRKAQAS